MTEVASLRTSSSRRMLALWAIRDLGGAFAVAYSDSSTAGSHFAAGRAAAQNAHRQVVEQSSGAEQSYHESSASLFDDAHRQQSELDALQRRHDLLMWLYTAPGNEEQILAGMRKGAPERTVFLGATSADETPAGANWWQIAAPACDACAALRDGEASFSGTAASDGVVVVCMHPAVDFTPMHARARHGPTRGCACWAAILLSRASHCGGSSVAHGSYSHAYGSTVHRATVHENVDDDVRRIKTLTPSPTRLTTDTPSQAAPTPVLAAELCTCAAAPTPRLRHQTPASVTKPAW
jgi:hypothetical protein